MLETLRVVGGLTLNKVHSVTWLISIWITKYYENIYIYHVVSKKRKKNILDLQLT